MANRAVVLEEKEWQLVIEALAAVSPTGGGSCTFTIQRRIMGALDRAPVPTMVGLLQRIAHEEYTEYAS